MPTKLSSLKSYRCCATAPAGHIGHRNQSAIMLGDSAVKTLGRRPGYQRGFTLVELLTALAILGVVMAGILNVYITSDRIGRTGVNKAEAQQDAREAMLIDERLRLVGYGVPPPPTLAATIITAATPTAITFWGDLQNASTFLLATTAILTIGSTPTLSVNSAAGITAGNTIYLINGGQVATLTVTGVSLAQGANTITGTVLAGSVAVAYPGGTVVGRPRLVTYSWDGVTTLSMNAGDGTGLQPLSTGVQSLLLNYFDTSDAAIVPAALAANLGNIRRIQITVTAQSTATQNPGTFTVTSSARPRNLP